MPSGKLVLFELVRSYGKPRAEKLKQGLDPGDSLDHPGEP